MAYAERELRSLSFSDVGALRAELEALQSRGYARLGRWGLGQACVHCAYYVRGSVEGFDVRLPWLVRVLLGPPLKRKLLSGKTIGRGMRTVPASVPGEGVGDAEGVGELLEWMERFEGTPEGELKASPLLGVLSKDEWRRLHLSHLAHHLGFLVPRG